MKTNARESNPRLVAAELFSSGVCNLSCSYCYIPKNNAMIEYHQKIVQALKDNTFINLLKETYGEALTDIGLWGTEQTLILHELQPHMKDFIDTFPNLMNISFSTNLVQNVDSISNFIDHLSKITDRQMKVGIQVSIDGPFWVTDIGRGKGVTKKIVENIDKLFTNFESLNSNNISIEFYLKATVGFESIQLLVNSEDRILEWFRFFESVNSIMTEHSKNINNIKLFYNTYAAPTLVTPGKYTTEDGKLLKKFYKMLRVLNERVHRGELTLLNQRSFNDYTMRFIALMDNMDMLKTKPENMTCSGADTQNGIDKDGNLSWCHRTFLFNDDKYMGNMMNDKIDEWDVSRISKGVVDNVRKHFMPNIKNEKAVKMYSYTNRGYHDFTEFRIGFVFHMIKELAAVGQASEVYLEDDELTLLLSIFLNQKMSCPSEAYLNTGSLHLTPVSIIRIFANGAFEEIIKEYFEILEWEGNN